MSLAQPSSPTSPKKRRQKGGRRSYGLVFTTHLMPSCMTACVAAGSRESGDFRVSLPKPPLSSYFCLHVGSERCQTGSGRSGGRLPTAALLDHFLLRCSPPITKRLGVRVKNVSNNGAKWLSSPLESAQRCRRLTVTGAAGNSHTVSCGPLRAPSFSFVRLRA